MATKALHVDTSVIMEGVFRLKTNIGSDTNTGKAYNPKQVEFIAFCDYAYEQISSEGQRHSVTQEKVFKFLCYHAFRKKKPRGRKKKDKICEVFGKDEFNIVMENFRNMSNNGDD